jgi:L-fuculose-phosphate aldolase
MKNRMSRASLMETCQAMSKSDLTPGRSGNLSARATDFDGFVITPSGIAFDRMDAEDMVELQMDGTVVPGQGKPSSKWKLHAEVYKARPDVGGIVVCQSRYATALACAHVPVPAFHYMVAIGGGANIRCAPYAFYESPAFYENAINALKDRRCALMANHGQIATGPTLDEAFELAREFENLCGQFWHTLQLGAPRLLSESDMAQVLDHFGRFKPRENTVLRRQFD